MRAHALTLVLALVPAAGLAQGPGGPMVPTPAGNPTTPDKVLLGKALFFEEQISSSGTVACATCHVLEAGGGDPRTATSRGPGFDGVLGNFDDVFGSPGVILQAADGGYVPGGDSPFERQITERRSPPVIDAAFFQLQFWDGRAGPSFRDPETGTVLLPSDASLEAQAAEPPVSDREMAHIGESWPDIVARLQTVRPLALASDLPPDLLAFVGDGSAGYAPLFQAAFATPGITAARVVMAIAAYERTLISHTPFDDFLAGDPTALTPNELAGFSVFNTIAQCGQCHPAPRFAMPARFDDIGVRPPSEDLGRGAITGLPVHAGAFKVPTLRNAQLRAPFFHNGRFPTMASVVAFYERGGDFPNTAIQPFTLTAQERAQLLAFLGQSLTDPRILAGLPPFDRPTLWSEDPQRRASPFAPASGPPSLATPDFVLAEPAVGGRAFTVAIVGAPVGDPGVLLAAPQAASQPLSFGAVDIHLDLVDGIAVPLPPTIAGGSGFRGPIGGVLSFDVPIPDLGGVDVTLLMQAVFVDTTNAGFVATPAWSVPLFAPRGT